jgi:hypothetical protein
MSRASASPWDLYLSRISADGFKLRTSRSPSGPDHPHVQAIGRSAPQLGGERGLIDGKAIAYADNGLALFGLLRGRRHDRRVALCAFDLLVEDVAGFTNALPGCGQIACTIGKRRTAEETDHRRCRLLRPRASGQAVAAPSSERPSAF